MHPRPRAAGLPPCALLLSLALAASTAFANPTPRSAVPLTSAGGATGVWQEFNLLQVQSGLSVHDPLQDELLALGGSRTDHWALPLAGPSVWYALPPAPAFFYAANVAWDPVGGLAYFLSDGEMHTLDPRTGTFTTIAASGTLPYGLFYPSLAFDRENQRVILVGSLNSPAVRVWVLDLLPSPAWSEWTPSGTPPPLFAPLPVLDPPRNRLLYFAAGDGSASAITALNLTGPPEWTSYATNGPLVGQFLNPVVYDAATDRMWTIDGQGDVYSLALDTFQWSHVPAAGGPSPRYFPGVAIDPVRHRLIVNGGRTHSDHDTHSDAWALSLDGPATWTQLVPDATRPPRRGAASDGYDAARHRLVVFGGANDAGGPRNDTWALDLGPVPTWSEVATQGTPPRTRYWHASAWDDARDQLLVYGGHYGALTPLGDLWALSFAGPTPTWSQISPPGPAPSARMLTQMVYDPGRDRFLLIAGYDGLQSLNDVWELRLSPTPAWRPMAPTGPVPPARSAQMCAYDPAFDRVILFGGSTQNGRFGDLWALNLAVGDGAWQLLTTPSGPSRRGLGLMRRDDLRGRLVLFGGYGESRPNFIEELNDTWVLDLTETPSWQPILPEGPLPRVRDRTNGVFDPIGNRLVLTCGGADGKNDLWSLDFGDAPTPTLLALATREVSAERVRLVWSGAEAGMRATAYRRAQGEAWRSLATLFANGLGALTLDDREVTPGATYEYRLGVMTDRGEEFLGATVVEVPRRALALTAGPTGGRATFTVELPAGDPATLAIFDVAGRQVWSRAVGGLGAGTHEVSASDAVLPPALYFARLTQGPASRFARVMVIR